jgi:transposase InsO family protein
VHANARLTPRGRLLLCQRVAAGRPVAHVAAEMGISRPTAYKWVARYRQYGLPGLGDRSSRPSTSPNRTPAGVEDDILQLRRARRLGPARIGGILGLHPSTVHRVLTRHRVARLAWIDRPTGEQIRRPCRYEHERPGDLVHVDIKKIGRLRPGGGWRAFGQDSPQRRAARRAVSTGHIVGYEYVHSAVDDHSRLAYSEILPDEQATTAAAFWTRAQAWFAAHGITVKRVLTDNGSCYRSRLWRQQLTAAQIVHKRTRPYRPQTNGKVERFNRTFLDECLYAQTFTASDQRVAALRTWLHTYNHHRAHTAIGGHPPISRVNNVPGYNT